MEKKKKCLSRKALIEKRKRILKRRFVLFMIVLISLIIIIFWISHLNHSKENISVSTSTEENRTITSSNLPVEITDWRLTLANIDHPLPDNFSVELANIDKNRQFDKRAIHDLNAMMNNARKDGVTNFWIQSSYRSIKNQKQLYENSIQKYLKQGKTPEEAQRLTLLFINKPGCSDHNLGLAVDFNYVENSFENSKAFSWLQKNAQDYGFILRYPKEKEQITKISYESWHWRYVGQEHAKKMKEQNLCLEEYIESLQTHT